MCGLVAVMGLQGQAVPIEALVAATAALVHRGPDDAGVYQSESGTVGFGFRRLAIIDLSASGHQPMSSTDGNFTIVFNGEIYNHVELRNELIALGHAFHSASDTEVLLTAYRQWGPDCVLRFNGMWAFLIHDRASRTVFGARDRLGVKPLYYWSDSQWLVMASEPRAMGASGLTSLRPNWSRLAESISWKLMDHAEGTCIADIRQIPAGSRFCVDAQGKLELTRYWELPAEERPGRVQSAEAWVEQLAALVTDALRLRMRSDVPVGFTLSGGLDSTLLICEAAHLQATRSRLLAFSYQDRQYDERVQIRDTVAQCGARLESIDDEALDIAALLPEIVRAHGEPVHSMAVIANYALFGLARRHGVKVVIGGQGADESLGGYSSYQGDYWHSLAHDGRYAALFGDVRSFARLHGVSSAPLLAQSLARSLRIALSNTALYQRLRARTRLAAPRSATSALFSPELLSMAPRPNLQGRDFRLVEAQRRSLSSSPLPMYLREEDRSSMAHSVEARLPFTDYRLVEHALRMPAELKHAGGLNKIALRRAALNRVPDSVVSKVEKLGFPVGANNKAQLGLHRLCVDLTATQAFRERGIYDLGAVRRLLAGSGEDLKTEQVDALFHLAQTELWLRDQFQPPAAVASRPLA
jgi:asparagine synthase (glutamine-hydrolysing)